MATTEPPGGERHPRRQFLWRAGAIGAVGAGAAGLGSDAGTAAASPAAVDVRQPPFGARGDGRSDDTAALRRALDAGAGGSVYFPPGDYVVRGPLAPAGRTLLSGAHTPRWEGDAAPPSSTRIRVGDGFEGPGLIAPAGASVGVTIRNLALVGADVGEGVAGVRMPDDDDAAANSSWTFENVSIAGFSGDGMRGRLQCALLSNCYISANRGWGINASDGNSWSDCHVANCFLFYNRRGNLYFGGSATTGAIDFVNCRFERAGVDPADVFSPVNPSAPGVRIASGHLIHFVNCNTDANTGNGFEIVHEPDSPAYVPNYVSLVGCRFSRDGTGANGERLEDFAGLMVRGSDEDTGAVSHVKAANCFVTHGKADDAGGGSVQGPRYGVWYERTNHFQWVGGDISASPDHQGNSFFSGEGGNWRPAIHDLARGLLTLPVEAPRGVPLPDGAVYYDPATSRLRVRHGGRWRSVTLE